MNVLGNAKNTGHAARGLVEHPQATDFVQTGDGALVRGKMLFDSFDIEEEG